MRVRDLTGQKFGMITVLNRVDNTKHGQSRFLCRCDCGNVKEIIGRSLLSKKQVSCGCYGASIGKIVNIKHGETGSKLYYVWKEMKARCTNPRHKRFKDYGARGIKVCKRWINSYINFKSDMGTRPEGLTLERVNNDRGYFPSNCKWATYSEQNKNKRHGL